MYNPDWLRYCKRAVRAGLGTDHLIEPELNIPCRYVGSAYGGWTIATDPLHRVTRPIVLSFGLGDDISFDQEMIKSYRARAFGFDPTPASLRWIAQRGTPAGMEVHAIGIAAFDGEQAFSLPAHETRGNFSSKGNGGTTVICQVRRYRTIAEKLELPRVDILKLDVEGSEYDVIPDLLASPLLPLQLLIEFHHRLHNIHVQQTHQSVERIRKAGYSLFAVSPGGQELSFIRST